MDIGHDKSTFGIGFVMPSQGGGDSVQGHRPLWDKIKRKK